MSLVEQRRRWNRGIGWIDAHLLASAVAARVPLWTLDRRLAVVARELRAG
jgi:predicted nucleic acid-binding protein